MAPVNGITYNINGRIWEEVIGTTAGDTYPLSDVLRSSGDVPNFVSFHSSDFPKPKKNHGSKFIPNKKPQSASDCGKEKE